MKTIARGKYYIEKIVASGSFGRVYADRQFAIKEITLPSSSCLSKSLQSIVSMLANEIRILTQLNHPNIVKVY
jgi:serine/threonine protein kinase